MTEAPKVLLIGTLDTKEEEVRFLRAELEVAGCRVIHMDPSIRRSAGGAEISPEMIAEAAGTTIEAVRALGHEGKCQLAMIEGALALIRDMPATARASPERWRSAARWAARLRVR
jgi:uncharacterized protein (UPF0261 family)